MLSMITTKCRVCLSGDRRMFSLSNTDLQEIWEKMTSARFDSNDGKPVLACYICCAQLRKSHQMMERALKAEELLTNLISNGLNQSPEFLSVIASLSRDLNYNYDFNTQHSLVCMQYEKHLVAEIKEETEEDYEAANEEDCEEENGKNDPLAIKKEEEGVYEINVREEIKQETEEDYEAANIKYYEENNQENNHTDIKKVEEGAPMRKPKAEYVRQKGDRIQGRSNKRKTMNNAMDIDLPKKNIITFNKNVSRNSHTTCNDQNLTSNSQSKASKNITNISNTEQIMHIVECHWEENDVSERSQLVNALPDDQFSLLNNRKKRRKYNNSKRSKRASKKDFSCHICLRKMGTKKDLKRHIVIHTGKKPYICDICDFRCVRKDGLSVHIKRHHTEEGKFLCHICPKKIATKVGLDHHLHTHTGEKPYKCPLCEHRFGRKCYLNYHLSSVHAIGKIYMCDICQYKVARREALINHLRSVHTQAKPYKCDLCDCRFSQRSCVNRHYRHVHAKEKNYVCDICQCQFARKCGLNIHLRSHTGERSYKCDLCNKSFVYNHSLKKHMKLKHANGMNSLVSNVNTNLPEK